MSFQKDEEAKKIVEHTDKAINGLSLPNRWTDRQSKLGVRAVSEGLYQP